MDMSRRAASILALAGLVTLMADRAEAGIVVDFTYTADVEGTNVNAPGSFTIATAGPSSFGLADLTSFSFQLSYLIVQENVTNTVSYQLSDLKSFGATFGPGGVLDSLSLTTAYVYGSDSFIKPVSFEIASLASGEAGNQYLDPGTGGIQDLASGTVTIDSVVVTTPVIVTTTPEPSSLALCAIAGAIGAGFLGWRRERIVPRPD